MVAHWLDRLHWQIWLHLDDIYTGYDVSNVLQIPQNGFHLLQACWKRARCIIFHINNCTLQLWMVWRVNTKVTHRWQHSSIDWKLQPQFWWFSSGSNWVISRMGTLDVLTQNWTEFGLQSLYLDLLFFF